MAGPDRSFWQSRFESGSTPWDRGAVSPQLMAWVESGALQPCRILVPGCGSGHEVAWLAAQGFEVIGLDYAPAAVATSSDRLQAVLSALPDPPVTPSPDVIAGAAGASAITPARSQVIEADVLCWRPTPEHGPIDAVYEQTCLCALHPDHWMTYGVSLSEWLPPGGQLLALLMQARRPSADEGQIEGPPYHCDVNAVRAVLTGRDWEWPAPPYARVEHPRGWFELGGVLTRREMPCQ